MLLIKHGKWFLVVGLLLLSCRWGWLNNSTNTIGRPSTAEVGVVVVANSHCRSQVSIVSRVDLCNLTQSNLSTVAAANRVYKSLHSNSNSHYTTRRHTMQYLGCLSTYIVFLGTSSTMLLLLYVVEIKVRAQT